MSLQTRTAKLTVVGVLALTSAAQAWGPTGHRAIARVAENHLTAGARAMVLELLAPDTLVEASTWPDEIRSDENWRHAGSWHYVNIADGAEYVARGRGKNEDPRDILEAIDHFEDILQDTERTKDEREVALRWLVHLIGDLHQPLHAGRPSDRGGNLIEANWHGRPTNMHRVWDSDMIDRTQLSFSELAASIDTASRVEIATWQSSPPMTWMLESLALRDRASEVPAENGGGSYRYSYQNLDLVRQRLRQAGVRLAGRLNRLLDSDDETASP